MSTRRERQRHELVEDILAAAREQLETGGPAAVSLRGIARSVGVSAPAIYTYFPSLNDLYTRLIVDGYEALASEVSAAVDAASDQPPVERLAAGPRAYRGWALANRHTFNLVFFDQIIGYEAPPDGPTVDAQTAALLPIAAEFATAIGVTTDDVARPGDPLDEFLGWWGSFHGLVALEVNHHLDWVDAEAVFERRLQRDIETILTTTREQS